MNKTDTKAIKLELEINNLLNDNQALQELLEEKNIITKQKIKDKKNSLKLKTKRIR